MKNNTLKKIVYSGVCLALALLLPFITAQSSELGKMFCLMHIPVLLCGFICSPLCGCAVGAAAPLLRSAVFGMPVFFPMAISMSFELFFYGFTSGFLYRLLPKKTVCIYISLVISMITGRIVAGISLYFLHLSKNMDYTLQMFISGNVITALPGIAIQIVLVPILVMAMKRAKIAV